MMAVLAISSWAMGIWWYPRTKSTTEKIVAPAVAEVKDCMWGFGACKVSKISTTIWKKKAQTENNWMSRMWQKLCHYVSIEASFWCCSSETTAISMWDMWFEIYPKGFSQKSFGFGASKVSVKLGTKRYTVQTNSRYLVSRWEPEATCASRSRRWRSRSLERYGHFDTSKKPA